MEEYEIALAFKSSATKLFVDSFSILADNVENESLVISVIGIDEQGVFYRENCDSVLVNRGYAPERNSFNLHWVDQEDPLFLFSKSNGFSTYPIDVQRHARKLHVTFAYIEPVMITQMDIRRETLLGLVQRVKDLPLQDGYRQLNREDL